MAPPVRDARLRRRGRAGRDARGGGAAARAEARRELVRGRACWHADAMSVGPEAFGQDYLYFYEAWLTDEVDERQTERVWRLLGLAPGAEVLDVACGHGRIANRLAGR